MFVEMGFTNARAQDFAQETFMRLYEHMDSYRGEAEWAYLESISRRIAIDHIRQFHSAKRAATEVSLDDPTNSAVAIAYGLVDACAPETELIEKENSVRLQMAIQQLPHGARNTVLLFLNGSSYAEIAQMMNVSVDAVKSRLKDARRLLRLSILQNEDLGKNPAGMVVSLKSGSA